MEEREWEGKVGDLNIKKLNAEERVLVKWMEKMGWTILNDSTEGDKEGEWMYNEWCGLL